MCTFLKAQVSYTGPGSQYCEFTAKLPHLWHIAVSQWSQYGCGAAEAHFAFVT